MVAVVLCACWPSTLQPGASAASVPHGRTRILLNHIPKAGGSTLRQLLGSGIIDHGLLTVRAETKSSGFAERLTHFVIAPIRDPCSYYVSLFAFGCLGKGDYGRRMVRRFGRWMYANVSDPELFGRFLGHAAGCLTVRTWASLPGLDVDCWVRTDFMLVDLRTCLARFEAQGGVLQLTWDQMLEKLATEASHGVPGHNVSSGRRGTHNLHINSSPHLPCSAYFQRGSHRALVERADHSLCELLGGCHCCEPLLVGGVSTRAAELYANGILNSTVPSDALARLSGVCLPPRRVDLNRFRPRGPSLEQ